MRNGRTPDARGGKAPSARGGRGRRKARRKRAAPGRSPGPGRDARSRTGGCGGVRRSSGAGRRRSERALGRSGLLGASGLASLQLGGRASGKGALRLATSLARHLAIGHHDGLLHRRCALHPGVHLRLRRHRNAAGRPPAASRGGARPTSCGAPRPAGGARGKPARTPRGGTAAPPDAPIGTGAPAPRGARPCQQVAAGAAAVTGRRGGSGRCRPPPVSVAAGRVGAAPDDHLQFGHLATLGFQAVGHAAHTAVESRDPQAKGEHGHRQHTEAYSHQAERRR